MIKTSFIFICVNWFVILQEVHICKQKGCGKIFTNQEEYKGHELLEALKIRFMWVKFWQNFIYFYYTLTKKKYSCREPNCGEELPDPGSLWRHYLEWHNNEANTFDCPYTNCGSEYATREMLEEHIESCHRHFSTIPTEPEIICFEGSDQVMVEDIPEVTADEDGFDNVQNNITEIINSDVVKKNEFSKRNEIMHVQPDVNDGKGKKTIIHVKKEDFCMEQSKLRAALTHDDYSKNRENINIVVTKFQNNKNVIVSKENYYENLLPISCSNSILLDNSQENTNNTIFISSDVSLTKQPTQDHRIELGNLEKAFRNELERDSTRSKLEENTSETKNDCSDDEEYTPKKQRMSRNKQESYKCEINGCGKTYKYISHFRLHQDSHKTINNTVTINLIKPSKPKVGKSTTIYV